MNNNNNKSKIKSAFFGYNLYSSSFAPKSNNRAISQKQKSPKKQAKYSSSVTPTKNRNNSEDKNIIETIHEESFNSNDNNKSISSNKTKNKLISIIFDEPENENQNNSKNMIKNNSYVNINDNMKVMVRIRPPLPREMEFGIPFRSICEISSDKKVLTILEYMGASTDELERQHELIHNPSIFQHHKFVFDYVFDQDTTQLELYLTAAKPAVLSLLEGYNSTIFAYGQTGTGKTYTMEGFTFNPLDEKRGIVPRVIEEIFKYIHNIQKENKNNINDNENYIVRASYLQIYNEYINDLLIPERKNLNIREDKKRGIYIDNLSEWIVKDSDDIYTLLEKGSENRATSSTIMNEISSRSHAIFIITVEQITSIKDNNINTNNFSTKISKLNLVDLAGSERTKLTGAKGKQLEESKRINKSLSALGNVINALTELKGAIHIPYRDSKLTRLLEDSLGGNCKTTMITMISPCQDFINETISSLSFARRAKKIKNRPKINEEINHKALISQYEIQLKNLRNELKKKNEMLEKNPFMRQVEQLTEDKKNIMKQLEETSQKYFKERDEKKKLENKIEIINKDYEEYKNNNKNKNNNNINNIQIEKTPQFISAIEERQNTLLKEFDNKLQEFQKNNNKDININNNEEIERYKELILKQREMMSTLTKKLNDRDETILQLQEDIEVYEKINEQFDNYLFLLNQNFKSLIEYFQQKIKNNNDNNDINIENYLNTYKKINNELSQNKNDLINNKNINTNTNNNNNNINSKNNQSNNNKKYLPYNYKNNNNNINNNLNNNTNISFNSSSISIFNNININNESPSPTLLTADEKIKELKTIIKEKENEINILKLVSQKFLSNSCESEDGKINFNKIKKSFQNGFELHTKIRELEEEKQNLKNENELLNDKLLEYQNNLYKIQNILDDIRLNNINNTNNIPSKNESLEKIVDNLNIGQAVEDINIIIKKILSNNLYNSNNRNNNIINNTYISDEILIKGNRNNSMDKEYIEDKDIFNNLTSIKDNKNSRNCFNPKIQRIISFNDKNYIPNNEFNINNTFNNGCMYNIKYKIKDDNLAKIANSLNNKQLIKKKHKKDGEKKFLNKFINVDK